MIKFSALDFNVYRSEEVIYKVFFTLSVQYKVLNVCNVQCM